MAASGTRTPAAVAAAAVTPAAVIAVAAAAVAAAAVAAVAVWGPKHYHIKGSGYAQTANFAIGSCIQDAGEKRAREVGTSYGLQASLGRNARIAISRTIQTKVAKMFNAKG